MNYFIHLAFRHPQHPLKVKKVELAFNVYGYYKWYHECLQCDLIPNILKSWMNESYRPPHKWYISIKSLTNDAKQTEAGSQFCSNWLKVGWINLTSKSITNTHFFLLYIQNNAHIFPVIHSFNICFYASPRRWLETSRSAVPGVFWYDASTVQRSPSSLANGWLIRHGRWCCPSCSAVLGSTFLSPGSDFTVEMSPCLPLGWAHVG